MLKQRKRFLVIPLIIIFFIILTTSPQKSVHFKSSLLWVFKIPLTITSHIGNSFFKISRAIQGLTDYERACNEIDTLRFKLVENEEIRLENDRLRNLLALDSQPEINYIVAQVIGKEPTNRLNSIIINKGSRTGIFLNQPVLNLAGVVGKIIEVTSGISKAILISDVNSRIIVMVQRSRQEGVLEGIGRGLCRLKYLSVEADVELGDIVVTAGVGGIYPKGLLVGKIESVKIERGGLYKNCIVKPVAELFKLEEVLCLKLDSKK